MDFEKYIRQSLENNKPDPGDELWAQIAAKQRKPNLFRKLRHYGIRGIAAVVGISACVLVWKHSATKDNVQATPENQIIAQQATPEGNTVAELPESAQTPQKNSGFGPNFSPESRKSFTAATQSWRAESPDAALRFPAEKGLRYSSPLTGTQINIPAFSLVHQDGSPVFGAVECQLREFRNHAEYISSGIPMHFADERGSFFFNSGGMFDIQVFQEGESLLLAEGQKAEVKFASTHPLTTPSLFYFDEQGDRWTYSPDEAFSQTGSAPPLAPVVEESVAVADNNKESGDNCVPVTMELDSKKVAQSVHEAIRVGYDLAEGRVSIPKWFHKNSHLSNRQLLQGLENSLIQLVRYNDIAHFFFPEDLKGTFTELNAFKGCYFVTSDSTIKQTSITDAGRYWSSIVIDPMAGNQVKITLRNKTEEVDIYANMYGTVENKGFDNHKVMANYLRLYKERSAENLRIINLWRNFTGVSAAFQSEAEWCMATPNWFDFFLANRPMMRKRYADLLEQGLGDNDEAAIKAWAKWRSKLLDTRFAKTESNAGKQDGGLMYAVKVSNFGLYNCDQIFRLASGGAPEYIWAAFRQKNGEIIYPRYVSVLERENKLYFGLPVRDQVILAPGRKMDVLVEDGKGRYFVLSGEDYAKLNLKNEKSFTFMLDPVPSSVKTAREWSNYLML